MPLVAPPVGGVLGAGLYKAFVEMHHQPISGQGGKFEGELQEESTPLEKQNHMSVNVCV